MSNVSISEAPTLGLGKLITENRFFVPTHQRDYKWDRDRVQRFIDDLLEALDRGDKFYFVGLMVFMRSEDGRLTVPNESNAFRVFETLNDRGMDLSAVDLIKNHLFGLAYGESQTELQQLEHRWGQLTQTLQNLRQEDFLKVYWTSRHGLIQLDDVFGAVKARTLTGKDATIRPRRARNRPGGFASRRAETDTGSGTPQRADTARSFPRS